MYYLPGLEAGKKSKSHQAKNVLLDDIESVEDQVRLLEATIIYWLACGYITISIVAWPFLLFSVTSFSLSF